MGTKHRPLLLSSQRLWPSEAGMHVSAL